MIKNIETVIVGAGHSGLAISYLLTKQKKPHIILERGQIGERWRNDRWDSLKLVIPNFYTQLPGFKYSGPDPQGFDTKKEYIKLLENYAKSFNAPVENNTEVNSLTKDGRGFILETNNGTIRARNVVVATGAFQKQKIPKVSMKIPRVIKQVPSTKYHNSSNLPEGSVVVVGSGNSGFQIAQDLNRSGRKVFLSVGRFRIAPRRYRGQDLIYWLERMGNLDKIVESLPTPEAKKVLPLVLPTDKDLPFVDLKKLVNEGINLVGHLEDVNDNKLIFSLDLKENLNKAEAYFQGFKDSIDKYIKDNNIDAPNEKMHRQKPYDRNINVCQKLKLIDSNITSVIWATGFEYDFDWLKIPEAFDENMEPIHKKGVSKVPRLYFIGLPWLSKYKSFFIYGAGEDAEYIANKLSRY